VENPAGFSPPGPGFPHESLPSPAAGSMSGGDAQLFKPLSTVESRAPNRYLVGQLMPGTRYSGRGSLWRECPQIHRAYYCY